MFIEPRWLYLDLHVPIILKRRNDNWWPGVFDVSSRKWIEPTQRSMESRGQGGHAHAWTGMFSCNVDRVLSKHIMFRVNLNLCKFKPCKLGWLKTKITSSWLTQHTALLHFDHHMLYVELGALCYYMYTATMLARWCIWHATSFDIHYGHTKGLSALEPVWSHIILTPRVTEVWDWCGSVLFIHTDCVRTTE